MTVYTNPVGQMASWGLNFLVVNERNEAIAAFVTRGDLERFLKERSG